MKILFRIVISRRISMAAIRLESIDLCGHGICFDSIVLKGELKSDEMFTKEVNIVEDRTIIECVSRISTSSAGSTCVKVFVGCWRIDAAVAQSLKMIMTHRNRDVMQVVIIEGDCADCFGLWCRLRGRTASVSTWCCLVGQTRLM